MSRQMADRGGLQEPLDLVRGLDERVGVGVHDLAQAVVGGDALDLVQHREQVGPLVLGQLRARPVARDR